jgi:hypothetical protein
MARKVELKVIEYADKDIPDDAPEDWEPVIRYKEQILGCLKMPKSGPTFKDWDEQEESRVLIEKVEKFEDGQEVIFDDKDWRKIRDHVKAFGSRTQVFNPYMLDLWYYIEGAEIARGEEVTPTDDPDTG